MKAFWVLLKKEWVLEWRRGYAFGGILLYLFSTVFIIYATFRTVDILTWTALFWIIAVFVSVSAIGKSFVQEGEGRYLYLYTLADPQIVLAAKLLYNFALLFGLNLLVWGIFSFAVGSPVQLTGQFLFVLLLGSFALSAILTFISAIAAKAGKSGTLMAVLSFPLLIPVLLTGLRITQNTAAIQGMSLDTSGDFLIMFAIILLSMGMGFILFPQVWKD